MIILKPHVILYAKAKVKLEEKEYLRIYPFLMRRIMQLLVLWNSL